MLGRFSGATKYICAWAIMLQYRYRHIPAAVNPQLLILLHTVDFLLLFKLVTCNIASFTGDLKMSEFTSTWQ